MSGNEQNEASQGKKPAKAETPKSTPVNMAEAYLRSGLTADDFLTDTWPEKINIEPKDMDLSMKTFLFHNLNAKGEPTGVNDYRIYTYLTHTQHIITCGKVVYLYKNGYYQEDLSETLLTSLIGDCMLEQFYRSNTVARVHKMFLQRNELVKRPEELNRYNSRFINFQNGMYDVTRRKLYNHEPKLLSTNQIPWDYDPAADHGPGDEIEKFLAYAIPDKDDREMLLEYIGLCCTKDVHQQKMLVICGDGGTGKSTVINLIQKIVGKRNTSNVAMSKLSMNFQAIRMMGKLLNSCADLEIDALDDVTMIKKLIGEDSISDSYKGKDIISFDNYAKLLFSTNELPLVRNEKTEGFYRRLLILTMNEKPEKRDSKLPEKLEKQIPYLLHMAMEALHRMYERGYIIESAGSKEKVRQLRNDSDTIEAFLFDCCKTGNTESKVERKILYDRYVEYCKDNERQSHQKNNFLKALRNKGFPECKVGGTWMFRMINLKEADGSGFMPVPEGEPEIPFPS